jgi:hypothetical protein
MSSISVMRPRCFGVSLGLLSRARGLDGSWLRGRDRFDCSGSLSAFMAEAGCQWRAVVSKTAKSSSGKSAIPLQKTEAKIHQTLVHR